MFRDFIVQNPNLFTDNSLKDCLNAGFIKQEDYDDILQSRNKETPAENGGGTRTPTN
ncbi:hypothetical protein [Apilactobacillus timberlakei]|uniref:hypothetical protein n=1 Tax=Apilactobacillus timberlakei TaxID=2008380 RepID=UPI0012FFD431|nr:hypothetical protein [Apilactobacillus timberlakei]